MSCLKGNKAIRNINYYLKIAKKYLEKPTLLQDDKIEYISRIKFGI